MKTIFPILTLSLCILLSCEPSDGQQIETLGAEEFQKQLSNGDAPQLVDVRTKEEYKQGHMKNALNVDYNGNDFATKMEFLDKSKPVFVYCFSGGRSSSSAKWLVSNGFNKVYDLKGGISSWESKNKPVESTVVDKVSGWSSFQYDSLYNSQRLVLINFSASWCPPCKKMAPSLDSLSKEWEGKITLLKIDAVNNPLTVQNQKVEAFPTLILYQSGKPVWRNEGYMDNKLIKKQLAQFL
ncbi:MAG: thioredoxin [Cytophagales bacterium]|nr:thioredoxin [Cytophagales bacterium]